MSRRTISLRFGSDPESQAFASEVMGVLRENIAKPLARGVIVQVYDDPLTCTKPAFKAKVLRCVQRDCGTYEGRMLRRYLVLPAGEGQSTVHAAILDAAPESKS